MWAGGREVIFECPRTYIRSESIGYLERFAAWRTLGLGANGEMPAREYDAFQVLRAEIEVRRESNDIE